MSYAFRNATTQGNSNGGALTVDNPAGTADGDLIVVVAYLELGTNSWASVGSGFNLVPETPALTSPDELTVRMWWKWASGEPATWTWTPTTGSVWRVVIAASYSGGSGSGAALDVHSSNSGYAALETGQTAPSVTTTAVDDLLIFGYGNWGGTPPNSIIGVASNFRANLGDAALSDANIATASATGTSQASGTGTQDFAAIHAAFFLSPAGGGSTFTKDGRSVSAFVGSGVKAMEIIPSPDYRRFPKYVLRKALP